MERELNFRKNNLKLIHQLTLDAGHEMDCAYIIQKIKSFISLSNYQKIYGYEFDFFFKSEIETIINSEIFNEVLLVRLYKSSYRVMKHNSIDDYYALKKEIIESEVPLPINDKVGLLKVLSNFCISMINQRKTEFVQELFENYKYNVENLYVLEYGILHPQLFNNIIIIALRLSEIDWVNHFISHYAKYINDSERENAISHAKALVYYHEKKYEKTVRELSTVSFDAYHDGIKVRILLLKAYFELKDEEALIYLISSFKKQVERKKISSAAAVSSAKNTIKVVEKILKIHTRDYKKFKALLSEVQAMPLIMEKQWIIEKLTELSEYKGKNKN
jgi:hypothetical protein